ncbi:hypothetical protein Hdeb2414_s0018g00522781 [Helianthus debilis subsp. tardiflorus]
MQSTTTSSEPLYKHIYCEIGEYPPSFSTFGCTLGTGTEGRSMELDRRCLLHMRVSTNASNRANTMVDCNDIGDQMDSEVGN